MGSANSTADRAIEILLLFTRDRPVLAASAIASHFGMSKSTTYRYLSSLRAQGLLVERPEGFGLGFRLFELASIARRNYSILDLAGDRLATLSKNLGETILLTQRVDDSAVILASWESSHPLRISYEQNRGLPFPVGASSKVLLAFETERDRERTMARLAPSLSPAALKSLRDQLSSIRTAGYGVNRGEIDEGVAAIAVPIGPADHAQYAISLVAPMTRLDVDDADAIISALRSTAAEISRDWSEIR